MRFRSFKTQHIPSPFRFLFSTCSQRVVICFEPSCSEPELHNPYSGGQNSNAIILQLELKCALCTSRQLRNCLLHHLRNCPIYQSIAHKARWSVTWDFGQDRQRRARTNTYTLETDVERCSASGRITIGSGFKGIFSRLGHTGNEVSGSEREIRRDGDGRVIAIRREELNSSIGGGENCLRGIGCERDKIGL
jgi:hypothetical protein